MTDEDLEASRNAILSVYGVLSALFNQATTGPLVREAQRHLAQWQLQPIANLMGAQASERPGQPVTVDVMQPLQAFDAGGRARADRVTSPRQRGWGRCGSGYEAAELGRIVRFHLEDDSVNPCSQALPEIHFP